MLPLEEAIPAGDGRYNVLSLARYFPDDRSAR